MMLRISKPLSMAMLTAACLLFSAPAFSQYARLAFYSNEGEAFQVQANGKQLTDALATRLQVRVNHNKKYVFKVQPAEGNLVEKTVRVNANLISADYVLKKNKKGEYDLKLRGTQLNQAAQAPATASNEKKSEGIKFEYETTESYSGPDGSYSKSEKGSGTLGRDGLNTTSTKTEASMDDKGFNMSSETKQRSTDGLEALGGLAKMGKSAKNKKAAAASAEPIDGRDLVVEDIQYAAGMAAPQPAETAQTAAPVSSSAQPAPAPAAPAAPAEANWSGKKEGMGKAVAEQGLEFYVMSEPVQAYEVVFEVEARISLDMVVDKKRGFKNMMDALVEEVRKTNDKKKYKGQQVDAIVTVVGSEAKAVRFTERGAPLITEVHTHEGAEIYLTSQPLREYEVIHTYENKGLMMGKADIESRTHKSIKRVLKENPDLEFDAVVSADGMVYEFVQFK